MSLKYLLQQRIDSIRQESGEITQHIESSGEFKVNKLNTIMLKLKSEKEKLELYYSYEVREKQELVLALAKEKKTLSVELQNCLKDIKKSKQRIKKHSNPQDYKKIRNSTKQDTKHLPVIQFPVSSNKEEEKKEEMQLKTNNDDEIDLMRIFEGKDDLLDMLQRDREFYESQDRKMKLKIHALQK